jgi:hypothetical protein
MKLGHFGIDIIQRSRKDLYFCLSPSLKYLAIEKSEKYVEIKPLKSTIYLLQPCDFKNKGLPD